MISGSWVGDFEGRDVRRQAARRTPLDPKNDEYENPAELRFVQTEVGTSAPAPDGEDVYERARFVGDVIDPVPGTAKEDSSDTGNRRSSKPWTQTGHFSKQFDDAFELVNEEVGSSGAILLPPLVGRAKLLLRLRREENP